MIKVQEHYACGMKIQKQRSLHKCKPKNKQIFVKQQNDNLYLTNTNHSLDVANTKNNMMAVCMSVLVGFWEYTVTYIFTNSIRGDKVLASIMHGIEDLLRVSWKLQITSET